ncbi:MAG: PAS domain-containing protein, partial [Patescibacteria group bacterium]
IGHPFAQMVALQGKDLKPLPPEQLPSTITMSTGQSVNDVLIFQSKDGKKTLLNISANPVLLDGRVAGAILLLRDVTKEKEDLIY